LPDLRNTVKGNISWPEDLVDKVAIRNLEVDEESKTIAVMTDATHSGDGSNGRSNAVSVAHQGERWARNMQSSINP